MWFYLQDNGEDMRKWDGNSTWTLEHTQKNCKEKQSQMGVLPGKLLLPSPAGSFPGRVEGLIAKETFLSDHSDATLAVTLAPPMTLTARTKVPAQRAAPVN